MIAFTPSAPDLMARMQCLSCIWLDAAGDCHE